MRSGLYICRFVDDLLILREIILMLIIRLSRTGKKNQPFYRVVLAEKTYPVQGKFTELLGSYNPHKKATSLKEERIKYWIEKGVACSDTVHNLLVKRGLIKAAKIKFDFNPKSKNQNVGEQNSADVEKKDEGVELKTNMQDSKKDSEKIENTDEEKNAESDK